MTLSIIATLIPSTAIVTVFQNPDLTFVETMENKNIHFNNTLIIITKDMLPISNILGVQIYETFIAGSEEKVYFTKEDIRSVKT